MSVPIALRFLLPVGIKGLFLSIMVMACSGDGGICIPGAAFYSGCDSAVEEKSVHAQTTHWALRFSITGVAVFAFCFSTVFTPKIHPALWLLTAAVFTRRRGAAIIGGFTGKKEQPPPPGPARSPARAGRHRDHHGTYWPNMFRRLANDVELNIHLRGNSGSIIRFRIYRFLHGREFVC